MTYRNRLSGEVRLIAATVAVLLLSLTPAPARGEDRAEVSFGEIRGYLGGLLGQETTFTLNLTGKIEQMPVHEKVERKYKSNIIMPMGKQQYIVIDKRVYRKGLGGGAVPGQKVWIKGKVTTMGRVTPEGPVIYVIEAKSISSYYDVAPLPARDKTDFAKYADVGIKDIVLAFKDHEKKSVHIKAAFRGVTPTNEKLVAPLGIEWEKWVRIGVLSDAQTPAIVMYLFNEQEDDLETVKALNRGDTIHIYGRVCRVWDSESGTVPGLVVDRLLLRPFSEPEEPAAAEAKAAEPELGETTPEEAPAPSDTPKVREVVETSAREFGADPQRLVGFRIHFPFTYQGNVPLPRDHSEANDLLKGKIWKACINKNTDLAEVPLFFEQANKEVDGALGQLEPGDTVVLKGDVHATEVGGRSRVVLLIQSVAIP